MMTKRTDRERRGLPPPSQMPTLCYLPRNLLNNSQQLLKNQASLLLLMMRCERLVEVRLGERERGREGERERERRDGCAEAC